MNGPGDSVRLLLTVLMAGWAMAFAYSFWWLSAAFGPEGFQGGAGAVEFLRWQGVALLLAIAVFGVSLAWPRGMAVRGLGVLPLTLAALVGTGIGLAIVLL